MEMICIEKRAWEALKQHLNLLTSEIEAMKEQYCPWPRECWLDSSDVCRTLGLSKRALQNYRVRGIIPSSMLGGKVYFRESDIAELLQKRTSAPMASGKNFEELGQLRRR